MRRLNPILEKAALISVSIVVTLGLLEIAVRIFMPQQLIAYHEELFRPDDLVGWRVSANLDTTVNTGERDVRYITDADGFRIAAQERDEPDLRILAIGDSFLQALQVDYEQSMTGLLETSLSQEMGMQIAVVNNGVAGWGPVQYALEAERELGRSDYDLLVVFLYTGNDITDNYGTDFLEGADINIRHEFRVPRGIDRQEIVDALLYPANDFLETRSHLYVFARTRLMGLRIRLGLSPYYLPMTVQRSYAESPAWAATADLCQDIAERATAHNVPVVFVLLPDNYQVDQELFEDHVRLYGIDPGVVDLDQPSVRMVRELEERDLVVIDTLDILRAAHTMGDDASPLYGSVDTHLAPAGHAVIAELLGPILEDILRSGE